MHYCPTCGCLCLCSGDDSDGLEQPPDACTHECDPADVLVYYLADILTEQARHVTKAK